MKKLGTLRNNVFDLDGALWDVINGFDELRAENPTVEYRDIHISHGLFGRTYVILVFEYEDLEEILSVPETINLSPQMQAIAIPHEKSKFIDVPAHISPSDPDWRVKLEEYRSQNRIIGS